MNLGDLINEAAGAGAAQQVEVVVAVDDGSYVVTGVSLEGSDRLVLSIEDVASEPVENEG